MPEAKKMPNLVSLADFAKSAKRKPEEIEAYVESGIIKTESYCYPVLFGDGKSIAFIPEKALADIKAREKAEPKKVESEPEKPKAKAKAKAKKE